VACLRVELSVIKISKASVKFFDDEGILTVKCDNDTEYSSIQDLKFTQFIGGKVRMN
jgi:hypothetical protein